MTISAIPTHYAGCYFRSRLEARWAVFFDALGIEWEYEPEGFATSIGNYLPDFRIRVPDDGYPYWFEVKPPRASLDDRHRVLCVETAMPLIVAQGLPRDYHDQLCSDKSYLTAMLWGDRLDGAVIPARDVQPDIFSCAFVGPGHYSGSGECPHWDAIHKARPFMCAIYDRTHIALHQIIPQMGEFSFPPGLGGSHNHRIPKFSPDIDAAYGAARSARFEHGQSGAQNASM